MATPLLVGGELPNIPWQPRPSRVEDVVWRYDENPVIQKSPPDIAEFLERYDPRVVPLDGRYYVIWCNNHHGYTIGLGVTDDFERFEQLENAFLPFNRNGVLFPRKIGGEYLSAALAFCQADELLTFLRENSEV